MVIINGKPIKKEKIEKALKLYDDLLNGKLEKTIRESLKDEL